MLFIHVFSISEDEAFSPVPSAVEEKHVSPVKEETLTKVVCENNNVAGREQIERMESEKAVSPIRAKSPERVGADGPYVHLHDHSYYRDKKSADRSPVPEVVEEEVIEETKAKPLKKERGRKKVEVKEKEAGTPQFKPRSAEEERDLVTAFLQDGVDMEDLVYLKHCYEIMMADDSQVTIETSCYSTSY